MIREMLMQPLACNHWANADAEHRRYPSSSVLHERDATMLTSDRVSLAEQAQTFRFLLIPHLLLMGAFFCVGVASSCLVSWACARPVKPSVPPLKHDS
jgi:hypothetical protein